MLILYREGRFFSPFSFFSSLFQFLEVTLRLWVEGCDICVLLLLYILISTPHCMTAWKQPSCLAYKNFLSIFKVNLNTLPYEGIFISSRTPSFYTYPPASLSTQQQNPPPPIITSNINPSLPLALPPSLPPRSRSFSPKSFTTTLPYPSLPSLFPLSLLSSQPFSPRALL